MDNKKENDSKKRIELLEENLQKAISESGEANNGHYTVFEIVSVLNKLSYNYNKIGLENEYNQYRDEQFDGSYAAGEVKTENKA